MQRLLIFLVLPILFSCKEKLIEPPSDLISEAQMTEILYDLALINGLRSTDDRILKRHEIETMPYIYEKYGVDSLQFVHSDQYYASVPEIYQKMYESIQQRIEEKIKEMNRIREQKNDSARSKNKRVRDSIRKASNSASPQTPAKK
ncbi:DUF4296 domain-containing protein [Muricauda sp. SCSIO 64092]|uniref:DUF4296 domain-containing protein n=1 Tax=Allomuricauda sp. SCSIO 64092 TaxID=2908842 RepID=UPI001FF2F1C5|nr:DUF4296 domain-containing protein [Muricauda sp. SCSIO 64092]UOY04794.1 DUF4296 domain-containing protein [Muricauda sp. SCSIO 64092]